MAGHFHRLNYLEIEHCSQLQKVFAFECETDDDGQEGIVKDGEKVLLHNLLCITLRSLPNFKEIHHGFKLKDDVMRHDITDCPKYSPSLYLHTGTILMSFYLEQFLCLGYYNVKWDIISV